MHSDNGELLDHSTIPVVQMINEATFLCVLLGTPEQQQIIIAAINALLGA
jgi:hypothetical protein